MITTILSIFVLSAIFPWVLKTFKQIRIVSLLFSGLIAILIFKLSIPVFVSSFPWFNNWWALDSLSALMISLIAFVYFTGMLISLRYIGHEYKENIVNLGQVKLYFSLLNLFVLSMIVTVLTNNSMIVWLGLESTTLSSTFLVGLYKKRTSIEAAWKYIILCSTGIALGLIGVLLLNHSTQIDGFSGDAFAMSNLLHNAKFFSPEIVKWAFVFLFVGFGTKVGFVPMHVWLPDAHSKAPSPISAIFSGILLNVALYVIIRFKHVVDGTIGDTSWTNNFFMTFGVMTIVFSAFGMLIQNNYKRLLAYSSMEHMGLIALELSLPPLGLVAAFIHMIGHTLTKSMLFFSAGEILLKWKTTKVENISNLMKSSPYTGTFFLLGILAIVALPPSVIFASEYILFAQMFVSHWFLALVIMLALSVIAFAMLRLTINLLYRKNEGDEVLIKEKFNITHAVMTIQFILIVYLTFFFTSPRGLNYINTLVKIIS